MPESLRNDELRDLVYRETCEGCKEGAPLRDGEHVYIPKSSRQIFPDTKECTRNLVLAEKVVEVVKTEREAREPDITRWEAGG